MLFQNKSFEVCSNRTLSEKYCQKRTEAVKRVLMCAETCMPLHCHSNSLNPLHSCRTTSSLGVSGTTVIGFYLNNPDTIFGYLHLVIRLANPIPVPSKRYVSTKAFSLQRKIFCTAIFAVASNFAESTEFCTVSSSFSFWYA